MDNVVVTKESVPLVGADSSDRDGQSRIGWVDYAKGICMIGVVTLYAVNQMASNGDGGWMQAWADFARPFRMPDFFLLSGLFLGRVIDRPWRSFLDKKVAHYLYFFALWSTLFFAAHLLAIQIGIKHGEGVSGPLWYRLIEPYAMLWFIQILPLFFVVTRLLRPIPAWILLPCAALLQIFPVAWAKWSLVHHFSERYVFFLAGYLLAPWIFRLAQWGRGDRIKAWMILILWICVNETLVRMGVSMAPGISLTLGFAGAMGVILAAALLMGVPGSSWLRYVGRHSLIIYVGFYMPMLIAIVLVHRLGLRLSFSTLSALVSVISAFAALSLFWMTRNTLLKGLFVRPAWAHIPLPPDE